LSAYPIPEVSEVMTDPDFTASAAEIQTHLNVLCRDLGNRIAASENEHRAAEYVARYLDSLGLANVTVEGFPFTEWGYEVSTLEVNDRGEWREIACIPVANSPSTPPEGIEAELVYVDSATAADLAGRDIEGKILLIWGLHGGDTSKLERLQECGAAAVLWVDDRLPFDYPVSVGTPYDWRDVLRKPNVCIPYTEAWKLARAEGVRARLRTEVWRREGESVNAFGDLPGSGPEMVHIGGHLDCVVVGVGADDDASGVAVTLEVARLLSELDEQPLRTIRFMGYGAEEQLSEGSRRYVLAHREEVERTRLCIQLDSVGSAVGRNEVRVVGPPELTDAVRRLAGLPPAAGSTEAANMVGQTPSSVGGSGIVGQTPSSVGGSGIVGQTPSSVGGPQARTMGGPNGERDREDLSPSATGRSGFPARQFRSWRGACPPKPWRRGMPPAPADLSYSCEVLEEVSPYSDMFAFNIFGAPSVWFYRVNMPGMRYFHHSALDDLDVVSADEIALTASATAQLAYQAAFTEPSWEREIPEELASEVAEHAARFYGL